MTRGLGPDSLRGRLLLLLLVGLLGAQAASALVAWLDRRAAVERIIALRTVQRVVDIVHLLDRIAPEDRARLARAARYPVVAVDGRDLGLVAARPPAASGAQSGAERLEAVVAEGLRERLDPVRDVHLEVRPTVLRHLTDGRGRAPDAAASRVANGWGLLLRTALADGGQVAAYFEVPFVTPVPTSSLLVQALVVVVATGVLVILGVRWVTRPLDDLAAAAERLGGDLDAPPLTEQGPSELRRAARAFNSMQERLSRYLRGRLTVMSAISHDLKTPLTRLRLRAEMLEDGRSRDAMLRDIAELETMVDAALEYGRGLARTEPTQPTDITALIESIAEDFVDTGARVSAQGRADRPLPAQPQSLKRCLSNLIDNACKYAGGAAVEIEDRGRAVIVRVCDRGPGIPEEEIEKVFDPFYRLDTARGRGGGTGLGLSIARNVAQAHHGSLRLHNREGGGLVAELSLPRP